MRVRIARWAWKHLVRRHVSGYRWEIAGNSVNVYAADSFFLAADDVEPVL